jgi:hypothetical protein
LSARRRSHPQMLRTAFNIHMSPRMQLYYSHRADDFSA